MKKILLVATVQSHICQFHLQLIKMLKQKGYVVHVAARNNLSEKNGLKLLYADDVFDIPFARFPFNKNNIKAYKKLKQLIISKNYDIVHCNTPMGGILPRLIKKNTKLEYKIIYTAHGFHFYKKGPLKSWILYYPIEKYFSKYTDCLLTINKEDYEIAKNKFNAKKTYLLNGVGINKQKFNIKISEEEKLELRKNIGVKENDFLIICIGELNKNKNQIMQIEAMKEIVKQNDNVKLLLAGNGPLKDFYNGKIKEYGLKNNIILLGYRTDIPMLLKICDCAMSTSIREGLGINILEAMCSEITVIASNNRGHRELIEDNVNGYLVDLNNNEMLIKKVNKLLNNKALREKFINRSNVILEKFTIENILKKLEEIYDEL